ncbi:hypothetical protein HY837_05955 [archaeon]|nr:hypothetical protein [archaeon]
MTNKSIFLDQVGYSPRMKVIQFFIGGRNFDYTLTDLLNAELSWRTLNLLVPKLLEQGIIIKTRKIGRATLYKINKDNLVVKHLMELHQKLILKELDRIRKKVGVSK